MADKLYSVKEVKELLNIQDYVLRFYEKELNLQIERNGQGHRVYTEEDIDKFRQILDLREQGLQLKAIENVINHEEDPGEAIMQFGMNTKTILDITNKDNTKVKQFSDMMKETFKQALEEYNEEAKIQLKNEISSDVEKIVDSKLTEYEEVQGERNKEYYRKMDESLREMQQIQKEMALQKIELSKNKTSLWKKIFGEKDKKTSRDEKNKAIST